MRPAWPKFYFWWSIVAALTGFVGFITSFWAPMVHGRHTSPVITIHAFVGSACVLFTVLQTWFVASRRTARHRNWGLFGVALATLTVVFGAMATAVLMDAPVGRFLLFYSVFRGNLPVPAGMPSPPPPVEAGNPAVTLLISLFVIVPVLHDWHTRGRPHAAHVIGVPAGLLISGLQPAIGRTETWHTIAAWIFFLAGK